MSSTSSELKTIIEQDRLRQLLAIAREAAMADSDTLPRRGDVVWYGLREAMDTLNRLPDREAGWLYCLSNAWPEILHDHEDRIEAYETMLERVRIGEMPVDMLQIRRPPPSAQAISRMELVFGWHVFLVGRTRRRDWKIICQLAAGWRAAKVAASNRVSRRTVWDRRELQCAVIAKQLEEKFGEGVFQPLARIA